MMMRMLEAGGLPLLVDASRRPDESNPLGFYEYARVKTLPTEADTSWLRAARGKGLKVVSPLLRYLPAALNYKVILVQRDLREVIASQNAMLTRSNEPTEVVPEARLLAMLEQEERRARDLLTRRRCFATLEVSYGDTVERPREVAAQVESFLQAGLEVDDMVRAVDDRLYRQRA